MCDITELLQQPLNPDHVKSRPKAGISLSYIESWHVINEANRIFGFLNWSRDTIYCKEVSREKNEKGTQIVGYEAKVRITVHCNDRTIARDGTGAGSGASKSLCDAIESAAKEAETDAMKRAFMTFGNPFGLALYDKTHANVAAPEPTEEEKQAKLKAAARAKLEIYKQELDKITTAREFYAFRESKADFRKWLKENLPELDDEAHEAGQRACVRLGMLEEVGVEYKKVNGESHATH